MEQNSNVSSVRRGNSRRRILIRRVSRRVRTRTHGDVGATGGTPRGYPIVKRSGFDSQPLSGRFAMALEPIRSVLARGGTGC